MMIHLKTMSEILRNVVDEGYVILNKVNLTQADTENCFADAEAMNVIIYELCIHEYHRIYKIETPHEMRRKLYYQMKN
jgi:hypothetical protein